MADGQQTNAISAAFPAPPPFYKHFTEANLGKVDVLLKDKREASQGVEASTNATPNLQIGDIPPELQYLLPPAPPPSGKFKVFGESYDVRQGLRSLLLTNGII